MDSGVIFVLVFILLFPLLLHHVYTHIIEFVHQLFVQRNLSYYMYIC